MGFSVSGSTAIIFVAGLVGASILLPVIFEDLQYTSQAANTAAEKNTYAKNTDINIRNVTCSNGDLIVTAYNNGSTTLTVADTDLLLNGIYQSRDSYTTDVEGNTKKPIWFAGERLNFTHSSPPTNVTSVRVITEYGVASESTFPTGKTC